MAERSEAVVNVDIPLDVPTPHGYLLARRAGWPPIEVSRCACGAEREMHHVMNQKGQHRRIAGMTLKPCKCPRCISCAKQLSQVDDPHPICSNLDCWAYGVWQLKPAYGIVSRDELGDGLPRGESELIW